MLKPFIRTRILQICIRQNIFLPKVKNKDKKGFHLWMLLKSKKP